jgi:GcrA cell cycle regulator
MAGATRTAATEFGETNPVPGTKNMRANQPTWTAERIELLKSRFAAGLSCREIAADIGVSRNAVIGKLSRLHLTRETTGEARRPARKPVPKQQQQMLQQLYAAPPPMAGEAPIDDGRRCSLFELSEARCRWPISSPGAADFGFCGNPPVAGLPYCPGHTRLADRPGSRLRVARR